MPSFTSEERVIKMWMLGVMLQKLQKLYPQFADTVYWIEANKLLAEFCLPEEERGLEDEPVPDTFYVQTVATHLGIPYHEVFQGFQLASKSEDSQSQ